MRRLSQVARLAASLAIVCAIVVAAGATAGAKKKPPPTTTSPKTVSIFATYYGWYTNTPPGCATADPSIHGGCAEGLGTYTTPITAAVDPSEFPYGTLFYYPTVEKYFVSADSCTECTTTFEKTATARMDLWMGGSTAATAGTEFALIDCEDGLTGTGQTTFVENPPKGEPLSTAPLLTTTTERCFGGATSPPSFGRYVNATDHKCLANATYSTTAGTPATLATCSGTNKGEDIEFSGAFFFSHRLCLTIDSTKKRGTKTSGALRWTTCTGKTSELWEVTGGKTSTLQWIEYVRCIDAVSGAPSVTKCTTKAKADIWTKVTEPAQGLSSAPGKPTATPGNGSATVSWAASTPGTFPIKRYTVTSTTGKKYCTTTGTSCTVGTLTNGTPYTFTVKAWSIAGTSPPSVASTPLTPVTGAV